MAEWVSGTDGFTGGYVTDMVQESLEVPAAYLRGVFDA